ncbi:hypothetical protein Tco_0869124 [Tanacetum coccineum]
MKNLDAYTFGDQFFNDKPTEEESDKANMETKVKSMVTVPIHQASSSVPPLSTPVIDITPPKPVSPPIHEPMIFTLELRDMPHKIDETVREAVREAIHVALQAPIRDRFRERPEADMKEILHQQMFESGTYKSLPEHVALYEALEVYMERANRDEFLAKKDKYRKRHCDDQDPPPPPLNSDLSKKKRHDSAPPSRSPILNSNNPIKTAYPNDMNISDLEDTDIAHLPKIKTKPDWLKPIPEEDIPASPKLDWVIPPNDLPETENN